MEVISMTFKEQKCFWEGKLPKLPIILKFSAIGYLMYRKLKCVCHCADPFKDLKWSNVPGVKLSLFSKSDDTFPSLQALSDLHYLFSGFMDYLWSRELDISNFGPTDRKILPVSGDDMPYSCLIEYPRHSALTARI
ncbi:hypothetical protein Tco_1002807 [Tanacetum coccineum]|uniref:Uncharacterized protein n=1 Tax=Tanacetum coccineum TaxID=301880 RepID=A0ABQ5F884_9ASTR